MTYDDSIYHVTRHKRRGKSSDWENMVAAILERLKVEYARQVRVEGFRVDFVLVGLNLIVEVDDPSHGEFFNQRDDRKQDSAAAVIGFSTVRVSTKDLEENYNAVVARLQKEIRRARKRQGVKRSLRAALSVEPEKKRHETRGRPGALRRTCVPPNCAARAWADNIYCPRCTMRIRRHGDPGITLKRGPKRG